MSTELASVHMHPDVNMICHANHVLNKTVRFKPALISSLLLFVFLHLADATLLGSVKEYLLLTN